jgi:hypothetical protein
MEKQAVLITGQNRRIKKTNVPLFSDWIFYEKMPGAWHTLRRLYCMFKYFKTDMGLVVDGRSSVPVNPYGIYPEDELKDLTDVDRKVELAFNKTETAAKKQGAQHIMAWGLTATIVGLVFIVIVLALLVASGKLGG